MSPLNRAVQLFNTIKFLKAKQIYYRLYYVTRSKIRAVMGYSPILSKPSNAVSLRLQKSIHIIDSYINSDRGDKEFIFLNRSVTFQKIDWNYVIYGKLWTYNLNYFDFLSQNDEHNTLILIEEFVDKLQNINDGLEPFPISLRGINWIKYLSYYKIKNQKIEDSLYAQYYILLDNLEYHLLGNHLLENGFSLLFGAYYFQDERLYQTAKRILEEQLREQIGDDGGHFEQSPMYHQIMLFRLLDTINLVKNSDHKAQEMFPFLINVAQKMLGWLEAISYQKGDIPHFNDSTDGVAPTSVQLFDYAKRLEIGYPHDTVLKESGYRKIITDRYELVVDVGGVNATYIAGHTHADIFNFELRVEGKPFIVDTGLSTYEWGQRREYERSTSAHNSVEIEGKNQSDIWGAFRVANRAKVIELNESDGIIEATHDGYKPIFHRRKWYLEKNKIVIEDRLKHDADGVARLHFYPSVTRAMIQKHIAVYQDKKELDRELYEIESYRYALGFNRTIEALVLKILFKKELKVEIIE